MKEETLATVEYKINQIYNRKTLQSKDELVRRSAENKLRRLIHRKAELQGIKPLK